jgi:hypothetical protein
VQEPKQKRIVAKFLVQETKKWKIVTKFLVQESKKEKSLHNFSARTKTKINRKFFVQNQKRKIVANV